MSTPSFSADRTPNVTGAAARFAPESAFRNFINDALEESFENGTWEDAWNSTVGEITEEPAPEPPTIDRY